MQKRVLDLQVTIDHQTILHVLRVKGLALPEERRSGDHAVIKRELVTLANAASVIIGVFGQGLNFTNLAQGSKQIVQLDPGLSQLPARHAGDFIQNLHTNHARF